MVDRGTYATLRCRDLAGSEQTVTPLSEGTRWALVPHEEPGRLPVCEALPLFATFLADPELTLPPDASSVLLREGEVVEIARDGGVFAFESAYFTPDAGAPGVCRDSQWSGYVDPNGSAFHYCDPGDHGHIWAPVVGVRFDPINLPIWRGPYYPGVANEAGWIGAISNGKGFYRIPFAVPSLDEANRNWFALASVVGGLPYAEPRQDFFYHVTGEVRFENFNPRDNSSKFFYVQSPVQFSGRRNPISNIALDVALGHFVVRMTNTPAGAPESWVPLVDAACDGSEFTSFAVEDEGDGGPVNQGLVQQISCPDLRDTDVYIFREADGALIGARWGMKYQEVAGFDLDPSIVPDVRAPGECLGNACLQFGIMTRGPSSRGRSGGATLHLPAATVSAEEDRYGRELSGIETRYLDPVTPYVSFLRSGDRVRVIVINRATGYVGTLRTQVMQAPNGLARIGDNGEEIILRPPNLKVKAFRRVDRDRSPGFDGETNRNVISFQGQALQSDALIEIVTEWLDADGSPLPEGLPGYTGRLARVATSGELVPEGSPETAGDTVGQFPIRPGRHVQVIKTPRDDGPAGRTHYYVHVDGAPSERLIDFSGGGVGPTGPDFSVDEVCYRTGDIDAPYSCVQKSAGDGPLTQRPADFVPFLVDHFDADSTRALAELRARELADAYVEGDPAPVLDDLDPVYLSVYSPEYRFTLRDLEVDSVDVLTTVDEEGRSRTTATVRYDNREPFDDPLDPVSSDEGLAMHAGYETVSAMAGESAETDFPGIDDFLAMTPARQAEELGEMVGSLTLEDFLTLGIYDLDDPANPLWELDGLPLVLTDTRRIHLERRHVTAQHGTSTTGSPDYVDDYQFFRFLLFRPSNVTLRVEDGNGNALGTLSTRRNVPPGMWHFVLDAEDLFEAGVHPAGAEGEGAGDGRFFLVLEVDRNEETIDDHTHEARWPGKLTERHPNLVLGQTATNDVLLRDGSLRLSRQDLLVQGRGPAIRLSRNYSSLATSRDESPFGPGWTNDLDMRLIPLTQDEGVGGTPGSIPSWVRDVKSDGVQTRLLRESEIVVPEPGEMRWTGVAVNGTVFRRDPGGAWQVERGRHGRLEEVGGEFVYTALDGTRYLYPIPQLQPPVPELPDGGETDVTRTHMSIGDGLVYRLGVDPEALRIADRDAPWEPPVDAPRPGAPQPTKLTRIIDRNDQALSFFYDAQGRLSALEDSVERRLHFAYTELPTPDGPQSRITRATLHDRAGTTLRTIDYRYDPQGYLEEVERHGRIERYRYRDECAAVDDVAARGGERNLVQVQKTPDGVEWLSTEYRYFERGELPESVGAFIGHVTGCDVVREVEYPVRDDERDPDAPGDPILRYAYDGLTRTVTNPRGFSTTYTLNEFGNTVLIEEPLGRRTEQHWSVDEASPADNVLVRKVETLGAGRTRAWHYEYERDAFGRLERVVESDPYGNAATTDYDPRFAVPTRREDRNGNVESWTYDDRGNLLTHTAGTGDEAATWTFTYDENFQRRTARAPGRPGLTVTTYDVYGNVDTITEPAGSVTDLDHDALGRMVARTDAAGHTTTFEYDDHDNLVRVVHPEVTLPGEADPSALAALHFRREELFTYDLLGNRLTETDRRGLTVTYTYTAQAQVATITRSAGGDGRRLFLYDNAGNLVRETDWKGVATVHEYDALDRRIATVNRVGDRMEQDYDLADNVVEIRSYDGRVTTFEYDLLDRLTEQRRLGDEGRWLEYDYTGRDEHDPDTNLYRLTEHRGADHASLVTTYSYDTHDRPRFRRVETPGGEAHTYEWRYSVDGTLEREIDEEGRATRYEYDEQGRRTRACREHVDPDSGARGEVCTRYEHDARGLVIDVYDALGRRTHVDFDEWGRAWRVTDADGFSTTRLFDGEGSVVDARDPEGQHQLTFRDLLGRVLRVTDRTGRDVQHVREYDANGNPTVVENGRGYRTHITYDAEDREETITEGLVASGAEEGDAAAPRTWSILERDGAGNPLRLQDALERVTRISYNDNALPATITDPLGQESRRSYTRTGQVRTETDRRGTTTRYEYDGRDRLHRVIDANGDAVEYRYDRVGNVRFVRDRRGIETETRYDDLDRPIRVFHGGERVQSMAYDAAGQLTSVANGRDHVTRYRDYDGRGNARTVEHPDGTTESYSFDALGRVATSTNEELEETVFRYDAEGRIASVTFAGETASFRYDVHGNLVELTRPESQPGGRNAGETRVMHYDRFDRLTRVIEGGLETAYEYDAADNLRHQRDPLGRHVEYTYDLLDRRVSHIQHRPEAEGPPLVSSVEEYDPEGHPLRLRNPLGEETRFEYDVLGRPVDVDYALRGAPVVSVLRHVHYDYDANGNVELVTETRERPDGSTYEELIDPSWDGRDRLSSVTTRGVTIGFGYDVDGNRTRVTSPAGETRYEYDPRDRLATAITAEGRTEYAYFADGAMELVTRPNGTETEYGWTAANRLEFVEHRRSPTQADPAAVFARYDYTWDGNGNRRTERAEIAGAVETTSYEYDVLDRLEAFTRTPEGSAGERTAYTFSGYDRATETVTREGATVRTRTYTYDGVGRAVEVEENEPGGAGRHTLGYVFDDAGNTLRRTDSAAPTATVEYRYDALDQLVRAVRDPAGAAEELGRWEYDSGGKRIRAFGSDRGDVEYHYDGAAVLEERDAGTGALLAHYRYADRLLSLASGSETQWYHLDGAGS
ncbi:MAG: hypothetical protein CMH59_08170, partial [Myxococcales bacterium]|nr:hypothetical protein [Myxococcales bacterium]